ncbi:MAG TPA: hypothetical protein GX523_03225 [Desulfitobacterium dehalogenans]|uniref:Lipoprotein n=1 Tax=Desulfitobacterium dehalogenans TaxID=36854 RepID=A0A7C6Z2Q4_9FIRM|nr:hypothetical protein [Desulfitobacterium dehalogenans]
MSKILKLISMLLIFAFLISGCGSTSSSSDDTNTEVESNTSLNLTEKGIIEHIDERLKKYGYSTLESGLQSTIIREVNGESYQCDLFIPSSGMYFYFLTKESTGELYQFTYKTIQAEISIPANTMQGYIADTLPYIFEPDAWEELTKQLDINNADDVTAVVATEEGREYHYNKNDVSSYLHAIPINMEVIDVEQLDFESGKIRPQQIDWYEANFVDTMNSYFKKQSFPLLSKPVPLAKEELKDLPSDIIEGVYYSLGSGVRLYLYTSDSGRLERVEYIVLLNTVTDSSVSNFGYGLTTTVQMLDYALSSDILDTINMADAVTTGNRFAIGGQMSYFYSVDSNSITCFCSRISPLVSLQL